MKLGGNPALASYASALIVVAAVGCGGNQAFSRKSPAPSDHGAFADAVAPGPAPLELVANESSLPGEPGDEQLQRALQQNVEPIGRNLADFVEDKKIRFEFVTMHNPRPQVSHTPAGHVSVSSGMLANLESHEELAAVLALEMAELIVERQQRAPDSSMLPTAGPGDDALNMAMAAKIQKQDRPVTAATVRQIAEDLLVRAGYRFVDVDAVHEKVAFLTGARQDGRLEEVEIHAN